MFPKHTFTFLQFLILISGCVQAGERICKTYNGKMGTCKNAFFCKSTMYTIMQSLPLFTSDLLRGNCTNSTTYICCPNEHETIGLYPSKLDILNQDKCGIPIDEDKIINGNKTELYEFPWMALIIVRKNETKVKYICGATIINIRYILTAAHCVVKLPENTVFNNFSARVQVGEYDISKDKDCEDYYGTKICTDGVQEIAIELAIAHSKFNKHTLANDIGLLRLVDNINMNADNIKPICLPLQPEGEVKELTKVVVTGWGRTESESMSKVLRKVILNVVSTENCCKIYKTVTQSQLCACEVKKDSCHGDSGGPLQILQSNGNKIVYVQYGIVSYGPENCTASELPGVYTKVSYFMDWILDNLEP